MPTILAALAAPSWLLRLNGKRRPQSTTTSTLNPENGIGTDRVTTLGSTLVVVRSDGRVFGSEVVNGQAQSVFEYAGAKIGFNPQDRFKMAVDNTLVVVTQDGSVFGSDVVDRHLRPVFLDTVHGPAGYRMEIGGTKCDV